jgi:hypothetical protein
MTQGFIFQIAQYENGFNKTPYYGITAHSEVTDLCCPAASAGPRRVRGVIMCTRTTLLMHKVVAGCWGEPLENDSNECALLAGLMHSW